MSVEELVNNAAQYGVKAMALTDINSTMGVVDFYKACILSNIHPIVGIEFRNKGQLQFIALARNNDGFREINEFLTLYQVENNKAIPSVAPDFNNVYIIYPLHDKLDRRLRENEFWGVRPSDLTQFPLMQHKIRRAKCVALFPVTFNSVQDYELHLNLRAIDENTLITKINKAHLAGKHEAFLPIDEIQALFDDFPYLRENTERLMQGCSIDFKLGQPKNKRFFTQSKYDDKVLLEKLAFEGMLYRYGKDNIEAYRRIRHELDIIDKLGFSAYFLMTWDIIQFSMSRGFYHVGRGSGANSIVAYCLKITNVDPIELDLYFERFINPKRSSPPDFDVDFSWKERDDVLDYIFRRYGAKHAALICAISTFRDRSIFRELGKVHGLPKDEIDCLVTKTDNELNKNGLTARLFSIGNRLMDFPNLRSIHAGGVLISEEPITYYTALDLPPKGHLTTQWDMYVAEDLGFEKFDILSQRGIGHIKDCALIVKENRGIEIDVNNVASFKKDEKVRSRLKTGEALGCFYVESPAMRGLLKKLRCDDYRTLVAASSIIRPGVAKSGMMKEYIRRFNNHSAIKYLHPLMEEHLHETFGVMVYQEDVIRICHHFAGLDLADADVLRRAMSGKYRSRTEFAKVVEKFFANCRAKGYPDSLTNEVWRQIESFAGYSFSKAHSASFAVESFQSLYLKTYFPIEHMVAVINNFGGFYQTWVYVHEAQRLGAAIHLPCVNRGKTLTTVQGVDVYLGYGLVQNLQKEVIHSIEKEREEHGPFLSLADFIGRVPVSLEQLLILTRIGALRFTQKSKKQLLWEIHRLVKSSAKPVYKQAALFAPADRKFQLPAFEHNKLEDAYDEIELIGFPVSISSFDMLETRFRGEIMACQMISFVGKKVRMLGRLVAFKNVGTSDNRLMQFGTFLDVQGNFFDTVHFPDSLQQYRFKGSGVYLLLGKIVEDFGFPSLEVEKMAKMPYKKDPRYE